MPTRFYLPGSGATFPAYAPVPFSAQWGEISAADTKALATDKLVSTSQLNKAAPGSGISGINVLNRQFQFPLGAQIISGTVKGQIRNRESSAGDDYCPQIRIYVVGKYAKLRGVLFEVDNEPLSSEFATGTLTNRKYPRGYTGAGAALMPVSCMANDLLIVEIGYRQFSVSLGPGEHQLMINDAFGDLPENETSTSTLNPWIEFSGDIVSHNFVLWKIGESIRDRPAKGKMRRVADIPRRTFVYDNSQLYRRRP